jgi:hypothetical protein
MANTGNTRVVVRVLILLVLAVAVAGVAFVMLRATARRQSNPYAYNLDAFKKTDPALIQYEEVNQIKLGITNLHGIAMNEQHGRIVVCGDNVLVFIDKDGKSFSKLNIEGSATCVAVDDSSDIYLGMTDHIAVLDKDGILKAEWGKPDDKVFLTSIALSGDRVFAADFASRIVWRYDKNGKMLGRIGDRNEAKGVLGFIVPSPYFDVAAVEDKEGSLWIVSPGRQRVEHYTPDGVLLDSWGHAGMDIESFCGCCNPSHIAIMQDGAFVTSEKGLPRIKIYEPDGKFRCVVAAVHHFDEDTVGMDLAVDWTGRILVLDPKAGSVRIFAKKH